MPTRTRPSPVLLLATVLAALALLATACGGPSHKLAKAEVNPREPLSLVAHETVPRTGSRPNILVIETDDMRWDELRWMPTVRRLIEDTGLTFANSFAPYPLCCPSRASFLSGKYAHNHGVLSVWRPWGFHAFDDHLTIATELQHAGYQTALIGKYLNGYGQMPTYGTNRPSLHYVPPGWTQWYGASDHAWPAWQDVHGGTYDYFNLTQNINGKLVTWPHRYTTDIMGAETRRVLSQFTATGKPWFVWWTPIAPHTGRPLEKDDPRPHRMDGTGKIYNWPSPARPDWVKGRFDAEITHGLGTPPNRPAEPDNSDKPLWLRVMPPLDAIERHDETVISRQRAEALYVLDRQIARTLAYLRSTGQYDHTVIVFTSDNGYYLGEHRKREGKTSVHEPSLRVPLLITGPGVPHGVRYDPVTTIDLAPTFAALGGIPGGMPQTDGFDLMPLVRHGDRGWRRAVVTEARMFNPSLTHAPRSRFFDGGLDLRGVRLGRWKLTVYPTGERELYDLATDPLELHNLATPQNLARHRADRRMLHAMMRLWARYADCKEAACRRPIPPRFRLTPAQERRLTIHEILATRQYYSDPGLEGPPSQTGVPLSESGRP